MTELADILDPTMAIINNKLAIAASLQRRYANTNCEFHVKNYGALVDGTTDDTAAWLAACAAADAAGGTVVLARGTMIIKEGYNFEASGTAGSGAVFVRGEGSSASKILYNPAVPDRALDCLVWGSLTDPTFYEGGGGIGFTLIDATGSITGAGIHQITTIFQVMRDVKVQDFLGTGGTGLLVDENDPSVPSQNNTYDRLNVSSNNVGIDILRGGPFVFLDLVVNQNTVGGIVRGGHVSWFGGMHQSAVFEFRPTTGAGIAFRQYGVYVETADTPYVAYAPLDSSSSGGIVTIHHTSQASGDPDFFIDASKMGLDLQNVDCVTPLAKGRNLPSFRAIGCADTTCDFDAATLAVASITNKRYTQLPGVTTAQRDALTPVARMLIHNSDTNVLQQYTGTKWKAVTREDPRDIFGSTHLKLEWDARDGIAGVDWYDTISGFKLAGSGTPVLGADGKFGGRNVWKFTAGSSQYMSCLFGSHIVATGGTGFYVSMVFRVIGSTPASTRHTLLHLGDNPFTYNMLYAFRWDTAESPGGGLASYGAHGAFGSTLLGIEDNLPHLYEIWFDPLGTMHVGIDRTIANPSTGVTALEANLDKINVASVDGGGDYASVNIARIRVANLAPSTALLDASYEIDRNTWSF